MVVPEDLRFPERPKQRPGTGGRWPGCWHLIGCGSSDMAEADTDYESCQTSWIDSIALSDDTGGTGYDTIHVDYDWRARLGFANSTSVIVAWSMYNGMLDCLDDNDFDPDVLSWDAIWQQLHCHIVYQIGGGATWDLEGYRQSNWVGYLNLANECSQ